MKINFNSSETDAEIATSYCFSSAKDLINVSKYFFSDEIIESSNSNNNHIIGFKSLQGGLISSLDQQLIDLSNKCTSKDDPLSLLES